MNPSRSDPAESYNLTLNIVFVLIVVAAYIQTLATFIDALTIPITLTMLGIGIIYIFVGIYGIKWFERSNSLWLYLLYFAIQLTLIAMLLFLTSISIGLWLMPLPLLGQSVIMLPRRWTLLVGILIMALFLVPIALQEGLSNTASFALSFSSAIFFVAVFTYIFTSERRARAMVEQLADELSEANQELRLYAAQVEELAITKERNRLAREIHDSLGHYLTVINVQLESAQAIHDTDPRKALEALHKAQTLTKEGLAEVRRSVATLRASPVEGRSLPEAVEALIEECRSEGMVAELAVIGPPRQLRPEVEHTFFRAAQEGLTNVRKHARASRVDIILTYSEDGGVRLVIEDNGVGTEEIDSDTGFGLLGLRERVHLLGGSVHVCTNKMEGFRLEVDAPA